MATYVNDLRLKEIATGDEAGTWGTSTNTNLELIAEAFSFGTEAITSNANTHTTTIADGSTDPGRSIFLKYTGALDSDCTITIGPNTISKLWLIENATTDSGSSGPYNIIIKQGTGATVTIPNSHTKAIYSDGAGSGGAMVEAFTDLNLTDSVTISGSTPTLTIGDAGAEDTKIVFDGNAQDFYIGLDDSADDLVIGKGSAVGTTPAIEIDENLDIKFAESIGVGQAASSTTGDIVAQTMSLKGTTPTLTIGDAGAEDTKIVFDGNAQDYYIGLDDSADDLLIGLGSSVGTTPAITIDENLKSLFGGDVEIGTTAPKINLKNTDTSVTADQSLGVFEVESSDGSTGSAGTIAKLDVAASGTFDGSGTGSQFRFSTGATNQSGSIALTEQMRLSDVGNLHLSGGSDRRIQLGSGGAGANTVGNNTVHIRGDGVDMKLMAASGGSYVFEQNGTEVARFDSSRRFLLGTTTVNIDGSSGTGVVLRDNNSSLFTVDSDDVMALNRLGTDGTILRFRNDGTSVGFIATGSNSLPSDKNFKKNIEDLEIGLELIKKLKPAQYNYKIQDDNAPKLYGLIAQDLEQSLTEVGVEKNSTTLLQYEPDDDEKESDYKLDYLKLTPVLINAIQEQQEQIEALQSEINTLKGE